MISLSGYSQKMQMVSEPFTWATYSSQNIYLMLKKGRSSTGMNTRKGFGIHTLEILKRYRDIIDLLFDSVLKYLYSREFKIYE